VKNIQAELYKPNKKQKLIHDLGLTARQRLFLAGNRTGKTFSGCMEVSYHLTGIYPSWWKGRRFDEPTDCWAASDTAQSTRDILQNTYMGGLKACDYGTGTIPKDKIEDVVMARGIGDSIDNIRARHVSGGVSTLGFKSYDQGRHKFQGTSRHIIHLDEEPEFGIYEECILRTATTRGLVLLTMTPLIGLTEMVEWFWNSDVDEGVVTNGRTMVQASWDDTDHLSQVEKDELRASLPAHALEAREKGIPSIGEGMVYPIAESEIVCDRFEIPQWYKQFYSLDFGWSPDPTCSLFFAYDPETDMLYITKEYSQNEATPKHHASNMYRLGADWMKGVADPYGGKARGQADGETLIQKYNACGLKLDSADRGFKLNGIIDVLELMRAGRLKVFGDLEGFWREFRKYSYDKNGKPRDKDDHFMDCLRYGVVSGMDVMTSKKEIESRGWGNLFRSRKRPNWRTV